MLGVAYKPDVGDIRESPAVEGDAPAGPARRAGRRSTTRTSSEVDAERRPAGTAPSSHQRAAEAADCVAVLTPHRAYDLDWVSQHAKLVFDARNAFAGRRATNVVTL